MSKTYNRVFGHEYGHEYRYGKRLSRWERIKAWFWAWAERYCL